MGNQRILQEAVMGELRRGERLQIMLSDDELAAVDDWRFGARMPSRASAIRELLRRGLAAEGVVVAKQSDKSKDYGVIDGPKVLARRGDAKGRGK
jgi:hypothetical protein